MANNLGFPQSSDELDKWKAMGRTFSGGAWHEAPTTTEPDTSKIEEGVKEAQTKADQFTQQVQQLSADQLKETGTFNIQDQDVKERGTTTANGYLARLKAENEAEQKRLDDERKAAETAAEKEEKTRWDKFKETFGITREEKRGTEFEELGVDPAKYIAERTADIAEMEALMTDYDSKVAERDAAIASIQGRTGTTIAFAGAETQNITNKYNVELNRMAAHINTKSAIMAQKQGLMNEAQAFAAQAVDDYTYDKKLAYDQIVAFEEENRLEIEELDQEYKDALQEGKDVSLAIYEEAKTEKTNVMNLMLSNPTAGITIDDTLEEATEKVVALPEEADILSVAEAKALGVPYGTTRSQAFGITPGDDISGDEALDFTDQEKRKLQQAGIDWATPEGYTKALNHLYGEDFIDRDYFIDTIGEDVLKNAIKGGLKDSEGKKYAKFFKSRAAEIEELINDIMADVEAKRNEGFSDEEILKGINTLLGI